MIWHISCLGPPFITPPAQGQKLNEEEPEPSLQIIENKNEMNIVLASHETNALDQLSFPALNTLQRRKHYSSPNCV